MKIRSEIHMKKIWIPALLMIAIATIITGCNKAETAAAVDLSPSPMVTTTQLQTPAPIETITPTEEASTSTPLDSTNTTPKPTAKANNNSGKSETADALPVIAEPDSITVLVNKQFVLPKDYEPADLVYPDVPFIFKEKADKRKMRSVAAKALEELFAGADKDEIQLAGASAYRSYATQKILFHRYVQRM